MNQSQNANSAHLIATLVHPIPQFLRSNSVPSAQQASIVRASIEDAESQLAHIQAEITRVNAYLEKLLVKQKEIETYCFENKAILAPIRRCLPEILSEIFLWCREIDRLPSWDGVWDGLYPTNHMHPVRRAPLLLARVCSHWRKIAMSTPRLWTAITVSLDGGKEVSAEKAAWATAWMERSASLGLHITLIRGSGKITQRSRAHAVVDAIIKFADRCEYLMISDAIPFRFITRFELATGRFTRLKMLSICLPSSCSAFASAQMLSAVRLRAVMLEGATSQIDLPWHQITRLSAYSYYGMLARCEKLVELHVGGFAGVPPNPITLERLKIFQMKNFVPAILDALTLPALREIAFLDHDTISWQLGIFASWQPGIFASFATRSGFSLDKITVQVPSPECFDELLRHSPSVSHLVLLGITPSNSENQLEALTPVDGVKALAPHLKLLTCSTTIPFSHQKLFTMIRARCKSDGQGQGLQVRMPASLKGTLGFEEEKIIELQAATGVNLTFGQIEWPTFEF